MAFVDDKSVSAVLNYGEHSDWVRNVRAAGAAAVVRRHGDAGFHTWVVKIEAARPWGRNRRRENGGSPL